MVWQKNREEKQFMARHSVESKINEGETNNVLAVW